MAFFNFLASILLTIISCVVGNLILAAVGDDVNVTFNKQCGAGGNREVVHRLRDASARTVASHTRGEFVPGPLYAGRLSRSDPLRLNNVGMNDDGLYELRCDGRDVARSELKVGAPLEVGAPVGRATDLPCHTVTLGVSVQSVVWEKEGQVLLRATGNHPVGKEFLGSRVSMRGDWMQQGDLSLGVEEVAARHGGDFFCVVKVDDSIHLAAVVRLTATPSIPDPGSGTTTGTGPTSPQNLPSAESCLLTGVITAAVSSLITALLMVLGCLLRRRYIRALKQKATRALSQSPLEDGENNTNGIPLVRRDAEGGRSSSG